MEGILIIAYRSILAFGVLLAMTRFMGKTEISQLTFFDYIVGITIGSLTSALSLDLNIKTTGALLAIIIWAGLKILMSKLVLESIPA